MRSRNILKVFYPIGLHVVEAIDVPSLGRAQVGRLGPIQRN